MGVASSFREAGGMIRRRSKSCCVLMPTTRDRCAPRSAVRSATRFDLALLDTTKKPTSRRSSRERRSSDGLWGAVGKKEVRNVSIYW